MVECCVTRIGPRTFDVLSSGSKTTRRVQLSKDGWSCTCPYSERRKNYCKHIYAAEARMLLPPVDPPDRTVLDQVPEGTCPNCKSGDCKKAGVRRNKRYDNQRYLCRKCGKGFSANLGFEKMSAPPRMVSSAIGLYCDGLSTARVRDALVRDHGWSPSLSTLLNWVGSRGGMADMLSRTFNLCLSEKWRTDGMMVKFSGKPRYLHMLLDDGTRLWICETITVNKATADVSRLFRNGEALAGKRPTLLVSDGDPTYRVSHRLTWRARKAGDKVTIIIFHVHARDDCNNNAMESFNSIVRDMETRRRGFKDPDTGLIAALRMHYNYVRPHGGLDGATPGEAAGITINGDKWRTLVQHARLHGIEPGG